MFCQKCKVYIYVEGIKCPFCGSRMISDTMAATINQEDVNMQHSHENVILEDDEEKNYDKNSHKMNYLNWVAIGASVLAVVLVVVVVCVMLYGNKKNNHPQTTIAAVQDENESTTEQTTTEEIKKEDTENQEDQGDQSTDTEEKITSEIETTEKPETTETEQQEVQNTEQEVTNISTETGMDGLSYSDAAKNEEQHFFVEHDERYYPMSGSQCYDENLVSLKIRFAGENFEYAQVHVGDRIVGFDGMFGFNSITVIQNEGYSIPQQFVTYDDGTVEFHRSNFNTSLYYNKCFITLNKIYQINGQVANTITDYVEIGDGWPTYKFLYYTEPTNIDLTYYKDYEQVVKTVSVDKKCFLLGDKYGVDYQEAPEGYFYYDTSSLPVGKYIISAAAGVQFAIEIVE